MKQGEKLEEEPVEGTAEGVSQEAEGDLEKEIAAGEWTRLREFEAYRRRSRQGRVLAMYQAVSNRLVELSRIFAVMVRDNPDGAGKLLEEIKKLRVLQDALSKCLIWEKKGQQMYLPEELSEAIG